MHKNLWNICACVYFNLKRWQGFQIKFGRGIFLFTEFTKEFFFQFYIILNIMKNVWKTREKKLL